MVAAHALGATLFADQGSGTARRRGWNTTASDVRPDPLYSECAAHGPDGHRYAQDAVANGAVARVSRTIRWISMCRGCGRRRVRAAMAPPPAAGPATRTATLAMVAHGHQRKNHHLYLTRACGAVGAPDRVLGPGRRGSAGRESGRETTPRRFAARRIVPRVIEGGGGSAGLMEVSLARAVAGRPTRSRTSQRSPTSRKTTLGLHTGQGGILLAKRRLAGEVAPKQ